MSTSGGLRAILERFPGQRILVLGDVILDRYWWGEASRLSPEAPVPVVCKQRASVRPGGAANTAANLAALGATVQLWGVIGKDYPASELEAVLRDQGVETGKLSIDESRPTTTKTRIIATHQQVVRVDDEATQAVSADLASAAAGSAIAALEQAGAVVISDYAKGFLTRELLRAVIDAAARAGKSVFVDPKGSDYTRYLGCSLFKPNRLELGLITGMRTSNHEEVLAAGEYLSSRMPGSLILVTEGADGMTLFADSKPREHLASTPRQVFDVTGAGDTVLATLAMAVSAGATYREAMTLAAEAAGVAIGTVGTAAVNLRQLISAVENTPLLRDASTV